MPPLGPNNRTATKWTIRLIPFFIAGAFGFSIYVIVAHLCSMFARLPYPNLESPVRLLLTACPLLCM